MPLNAKKTIQKAQYPKSLISDLKGQMEAFPKGELEVPLGSRFKKIIGIGFLIVCTTSLAYLAYSAFKYSNPPTNLEEIPLIKADHTPVRVVPTDPGGEQILNQDKLIYNNLQDPHFKREKKPEAQIEDDMRARDVNLRSPRQAVHAKIEAPKTKKPAAAKNPFEVLDEER